MKWNEKKEQKKNAHTTSEGNFRRPFKVIKFICVIHYCTVDFCFLLHLVLGCCCFQFKRNLLLSRARCVFSFISFSFFMFCAYRSLHACSHLVRAVCMRMHNVCVCACMYECIANALVCEVNDVIYLMANDNDTNDKNLCEEIHCKRLHTRFISLKIECMCANHTTRCCSCCCCGAHFSLTLWLVTV